MKLLFVAAERRELRYLGPAIRIPASPGTRMACSTVRVGSHEALLVANGAGWKRAAMAVDRAIQAWPPDAVISTGFCGALDPSLDIGDLVVATAVEGAGCTYPAAAFKGARAAHSGVVCSIDHVAQTAAEKARLRERGGSVVEMEAAAVAERAQAYGLPFYCVKAVTDLASEDLANDYNASLTPEGHFDTMLILKAALHHPTVRLPELLRLRKRTIRAGRTLGEFIADCRF